ncbi:Major intracellular serine protease precursor [Blastopirellula retiformator]|uniref:Major intracellular serine protease n=1 Tax=Blastopirellula retiformator TaxID=2527970 RepID=A0A5C5VJC1_9BACT|nr:S8 family serine peptidase [Blastopirellula retiformator]TWT38706.1 Major intracellular serine protease precursor [Blastopirellula retiformator]
MIANDKFFALPPVHRSPFTIRKSSDEFPYHLADPGWPEIRKRSGAGEGIKVGVVDTGVDETHPEVQESLVDARDFSGSRSGPVDVDGHGTHVASTIAGKHVGVAPRAKLYIAKALGDNGSGSDRAVANAIFWLIDQGVDIINMSLGSPSPSPASQPDDDVQAGPIGREEMEKTELLRKALPRAGRTFLPRRNPAG